MTEDDVRQLLRELRDEPVPAESLRRVEERVAARTGRRRWPVWAALAAAAAGVALLALWPRVPEAPKVVSLPLPPAPVVVEAPAPAPPSRPRIRPVVRRVVKKTPAEPEVVIRIETPDPDVVILLIGE